MPSDSKPRPVAPLSPRTVFRGRRTGQRPFLVAPLPYLNFLRHLKMNIFRRYGLRRLLQVAPPYWDALTEAQQRKFHPQHILARMVRSSKAARARMLLRRSRQGQSGKAGAPKVRRPIYDKRPKPQKRRKKKSQIEK